MNDIEQYNLLTREMYNGMSIEKRRKWIMEFIVDSINHAQAWFEREYMTLDAENALREKIDRLKLIEFVLNEYYSCENQSEFMHNFREEVFNAEIANNAIIHQVKELTFSEELDPEQRKIQLSSVLPNYLFIHYEFEGILDELA